MYSDGITEDLSSVESESSRPHPKSTMKSYLSLMKKAVGMVMPLPWQNLQRKAGSPARKLSDTENRELGRPKQGKTGGVGKLWKFLTRSADKTEISRPPEPREILAAVLK